MSRDRRQSPRVQTTYRMDVCDDAGRAVGCLLDVSLGGLRLFCDDRIDLGGTSELEIRFARWLQLGEGMSLPGRFVWMRPTGRGTAMEAGFLFDKLNRNRTKALTRFIDAITEAAEYDRRSAA